MGIMVMKISMFSVKIVIGMQVDVMVFEGVELVIMFMYFEFVNNDDVMQILFLGSKISCCIMMSDQIIEGDCQDGQILDLRGLVVFELYSKVNGYVVIDGY